MLRWRARPQAKTEWFYKAFNHIILTVGICENSTGKLYLEAFGQVCLSEIHFPNVFIYQLLFLKHISWTLNPYIHAALKQGFDCSMKTQRGLYKRSIEIAKNSVLITFCIYSLIDNQCVNFITFVIIKMSIRKQNRVASHSGNDFFVASLKTTVISKKWY